MWRPRCFAPCVNPYWANRGTLNSVPEIGRKYAKRAIGDICANDAFISNENIVRSRILKEEHNRLRIGFPFDPKKRRTLFHGTNQRGFTMKRNTRKTLLLGTVALMAGVGLASAQGIREGGSATGGAEQHSMPSGSPAAKAPGGGEIQNKGTSETRGQMKGRNRAKSSGATARQEPHERSGKAGTLDHRPRLV
jgi:hypothetical protein